MSDIEDVCDVLGDSLYDAYIATLDAYNKECRVATVMWKRVHYLLNRIESAWCKYHKPKKYLRTGIKPKYQNRTRKKQRLTRLQRRWKRQRK